MTVVINDPLGQIHNPANSDHYSHLKIFWFWRSLEKWGRTDERQTPPAKILNNTGRVCGPVEWINYNQTIILHNKLFYTKLSWGSVIL